MPGSGFSTYKRKLMIYRNFTQKQTNTFEVILSRQAILILAAVAGASNLKVSVTPLSNLAAFIASLTAKNTELDKNSGGSPTA